jgi:hypothetical protein
LSASSRNTRSSWASTTALRALWSAVLPTCGSKLGRPSKMTKLDPLSASQSHFALGCIWRHQFGGRHLVSQFVVGQFEVG